MLSKDDKVEMFRLLLLVRFFEEEANKAYKQGELPRPPHSSIGQEAIGVGACYGLNNDDYVIPSLRTRAALITKGVPLKAITADMFGKAGGPSGGWADEHHMGYPDAGIVGTSAVVGGHLTIAAGVALASKYKKTKQVTLCFFGDGASCRGDFHTSVNFAAVKKLPILFIIENNQYAITEHISHTISIADLADRAISYGISGEKVDGNDLIAIYEIVQKSIKKARDGEGPSLIECKTYRFQPHNEGHPEDRPKKEVEAWKKKCPLKRFQELLVKERILNNKKISDIEITCKDEIKEAFEFAKEAPFPEPEKFFPKFTCA